MAQQSPDTVQVPNQLQVIQQLAGLLSGGGQIQTTTGTANIAPLEALLRQLQGADYRATLEAIFSQAAGSIPGLQQRMVHAAGARSGSNSAMEAALKQLLATTATQAQETLVKQQQENQRIQANAAANIAQSTRGEQRTTRAQTATGSQLGDIAAMIAAMQGLTRLTGSSSVQDMLGKLTGGSNRAETTTALAPVQTANVTPAASITSAAPVTSAQMPSFSLGSAPSSGLGMVAGNNASGLTAPSAAPMPTFNQGSWEVPTTDWANIFTPSPQFQPLPQQSLGFNPTGDLGLSPGGGLGFRAPDGFTW